MNKMKDQYFFTKKIAELILSISGALIFGGYVRDQILHDYAAKKFYELSEDCEKYEDKSFLPELSDRCLVANDIDCLMSDDNILILEDKLKSHGLKLIRGSDKMLTSYCFPCDGEKIITRPNLKVLRAKVVFNVSPLFTNIIPIDIRKMSVKIDIVHAPSVVDIEPPFEILDFTCNTLILNDVDQIRVSYNISSKYEILERLNILNETVDDIINKRAKMINYAIIPNRYRVNKMLHKGFTIYSSDKNIKISPNSSHLTEEDICIICHDSFTRNSVCKLDCCAALYHRTCLKETIQAETFRDECPMCREHIFSNDIDIINRIV